MESAVKLENQTDAKRFLQDLGLIKEEVTRAAITALEKGSTIYDLWAPGHYRDGKKRSPICARGTAKKIGILWQEGRLQPYWDYLGANLGVGQQSSLKSEAAGTGDSAQVGDGNTGLANDGPKQTRMDWSVVDISVRARLLRDILGKIMEFLKIHCEGNLIILWDEVDNYYIRLLGMLNDLLSSPGLEDLQKAVPALPFSLHSMGEDADSEWEFLRDPLSRYKGRILEFCAYIGDEPTEDPIFPALSAALSNTFDIVLRSFRHQKARKERKFWADNEPRSKSESSKSGPTPEGSREPEERPKPTGT